MSIDNLNTGVSTFASRKNRELTDEHIAQIANVYHEWRKIDGKYEDVAGFCKAATMQDVETNGFVLTPGRYVGTEVAEADAEAYEAKVARLSEALSEQFAQSAQLQNEIRKNLKSIGIDIA